MTTKETIILAFSGGLDTSAIIPWLKDHYPNSGIIAYCADLGNSPDRNQLSKLAEKLGAQEFIFDDLRNEFTANYVFPSILAGAAYHQDYLLGTAIGRPLIAERMAYYAHKMKASALAHGATGKGNDQLRFEKAWATLCPDLKIIAPWKEWTFKGRRDLVNYLSSKGHDFENQAEAKKYSEDINLFHRSCEGGELEDLDTDYDQAQVLKWITPPDQWSNDPVHLSIHFKNGIPVKLNGSETSPAELLTQLNAWGGEAGIGIEDMVEERSIGIKSRGIYETPGGTILHFALKKLKHLCWSRELIAMSEYLGARLGDIIYDGLWFSDSREAINAFFNQSSCYLDGEINLMIYKGQIKITGRKSRYSLYDKGTVSFEEDQDSVNKLAQGYSYLSRLSSRQQGKRNKNKGK